MGFDLDNEELKETREKLGLQGKCKDCLGCELLNTFGFKGTNKCNGYIRANEIDSLDFLDYVELAIIIICPLICFGILLYGMYLRFSILCGG